MRTLAAVVLLAACGSSGARTTEIASDDEVLPTRVDAKTIAASLRVAEVLIDGTVWISAEGGPLAPGARMWVGILEPFDGEPVGYRVLTVEVEGRVEEFVDAEGTQTFLVCGDSRGGEPPAIYRAHVTAGSVDALPPFAAAVAWPLELELDYSPATGEASADAETIQLDGDAELEAVQHVIRFHEANAACPFPFDTSEVVLDDGRRVAARPPELGCFSQIPMFHEMACCSEPACTPGDPRALCRWPPSPTTRFEPDLAPPAFTGSNFVANTRGPIAGVLRSAGAAVWIRHRRSFEGEAFAWYHADGDAIVEAGGEYLYHCAY